jgi:hypothetical protein
VEDSPEGWPQRWDTRGGQFGGTAADLQWSRIETGRDDDPRRRERRVMALAHVGGLPVEEVLRLVPAVWVAIAAYLAMRKGRG